MNQIGRITVDPDKCGGRPCIRTTRVRVKDVLEMLASGMTKEEILQDFPYLEADDISAALRLAMPRSKPTILFCKPPENAVSGRCAIASSKRSPDGMQWNPGHFRVRSLITLRFIRATYAKGAINRAPTGFYH